MISPRHSDSQRRIIAGEKIDTWHPGSTFDGLAQCAKLIVFVLSAALASCSVPEQPTHVAVKANVPGFAAAPTSASFPAPPAKRPPEQATSSAAAPARLLAATAAATSAQSAIAGTIAAPAHRDAAPFELVGTSISDEKAFAFLKQSGQDLVTVHEGDRVDGFTVAAIAPDRIKLESSDHAEQVLTMGTAASPGPTASLDEADYAVPATEKIVGEVNTDQSIPEHVTLGPTGSLPPGMKQVGH